jgi:L-seryl-tRNA(Ser) seleniumtransferase
MEMLIMTHNDPRAFIPQVEIILSRPDFEPYILSLSRPLVSAVISKTLNDLRKTLALETQGIAVAEKAFALCKAALEKAERKSLRKVLNGTGVVLHTNLGRSPLSKEIWEKAESVNTGYTNLEFNVDEGERGSRGGLVPELLARISGAESGLAVNNNAAAVLLVLSALAQGRDVIVSRGEAVQIGGGFRIPDILALSGAKLKEVGTTNITTAEDYQNAFGSDTAAVLVVHTSNFALRGFTEKPSLAKLSQIKPEGVPLIIDQGSGCTGEALAFEASVAALIRDGADLVCFSGDKILGGPQAGLIVGKADLVAKLARHPLMRAFRPGKTILSLLEAVLIERLGTVTPALLNEVSHGSAVEKALKLSAQPEQVLLNSLGTMLLKTMPEGRALLADSAATIGGGSTPDETIPSRALILQPIRSAEALSRALRTAPTPLIARIEGGKVVVDLISLVDEDWSLVTAALLAGFEAEPRQ